MKKTKAIAKLIYELEFLIGTECYNPNSYDGYSGEEGCSFRYPVFITPNDDSAEDFKFYSKVNNEMYIQPIQPKMIPTMKYKFGSNHLYIGNGLIKALEYLEKRYGISFNELEKSKNDNMQ